MIFKDRDGRHIGALASLVGIGSDECLAVRRHATRLESRSDWDAALEAYRVAVLLDPMQPASWRGLSRVLTERGETQAAEGAHHLADLLEAKQRGEKWTPRKRMSAVVSSSGGSRWKA